MIEVNNLKHDFLMVNDHPIRESINNYLCLVDLNNLICSEY